MAYWYLPWGLALSTSKGNGREYIQKTATLAPSQPQPFPPKKRNQLGIQLGVALAVSRHVDLSFLFHLKSGLNNIRNLKSQ